jgi:hypothetical protein
MPTLNLTEDQVIQLLEQLPPQRRTEILLRLARDAGKMREENLENGEKQMHRLAAERGLNWGAMSDQERIAFVDDLIHEDRGCAR